MWDLKQRNFFCVRLRPHSLWTQAGKRSTLGCGCRDSQCIESAAALLSLPMSLSSGSRHRGGEWVTYLDLLNSFHQWQKSNYLPGNARLLYYGLLAVFNEARWPEQVQIDNFRLMSMRHLRPAALQELQTAEITTKCGPSSLTLPHSLTERR